MTPDGIPEDVWNYFVAEADEIRAKGWKHYGARTIAEFIRHHRNIKKMDKDFVLNNNIIPRLAREYMALRGCHGFFETREKKAA